MTQPTKLPPALTSSHFLYCILLIVQFWFLSKVCIVVHKKNGDPLPLEQNSHLSHQVWQSTRMAFAFHLHPLHSAQHNPTTPEMGAPINYCNATNATLHWSGQVNWGIIYKRKKSPLIKCRSITGKLFPALEMDPKTRLSTPPTSGLLPMSEMSGACLADSCTFQFLIFTIKVWKQEADKRV